MKKFVAFLDILGFSQLLNENELAKVEQIFDDCLKNLNDKKYSGDCTIQSGIDSMSSKDDLKFLMISDSIIIYTDNDTSDSLNVLIHTCKRLLISFLEEGIPLRGAISIGDLKEIEIDNKDNKPHFKGLSIIGNAITRAHRLEKEQEWMGCIIDQRCFDHHQSVSILGFIEYDNTPFKGCTRSANVLNWANDWQEKSVEEVEKILCNSFTSHNKGLDDSVKKKRDNTLLFFKYVKANNLFIHLS